MRLAIRQCAACAQGLLAACASAADTDVEQESAREDTPRMEVDHGGGHGERPFEPPPPRHGYVRIEAPVIERITPGTDQEYCHYVTAPLDRDLDVLDVDGFQSTGGHHAVAYAIQPTAPVGTSRPCTDDDNLVASFLGGIGGEGSAGAVLPPGVAFRLPRGHAIQVNAHYVNGTDHDLTGRAVLDFAFAEVTTERTVASLFSNGSLTFSLPPGERSTLVAECVVPRELRFIMIANHMHDHGASARTEVVRMTGEIELLQEDPRWRKDMAYQPVFRHYPPEQPLVLRPGDIVRTRCDWNNTTDDTIAFPREMCFGTGFFLSDGATRPLCLDGAWQE